MIGAIIAKKKIRSAFANLNRRDLPAFLANFAEDCIYVVPGNISVSGTIKGKKNIEEWWRKFMEQFPKVMFTLKNVCVQNIFAFSGTNTVTAEWDDALVNREGKECPGEHGVTVANIRKGRIVLLSVYKLDTELMREAWGEDALPPKKSS